jgi:hypothetical protein
MIGRLDVVLIQSSVLRFAAAYYVTLASLSPESLPSKTGSRQDLIEPAGASEKPGALMSRAASKTASSDAAAGTGTGSLRTVTVTVLIISIHDPAQFASLQPQGPGRALAIAVESDSEVL